MEVCAFILCFVGKTDQQEISTSSSEMTGLQKEQEMVHFRAQYE